MTIPATTIVRQYVTQSPLNLAIVNYVAKKVECSFAELTEIFEDTDLPCARRTFRQRLNYLGNVGQLAATGRGDGRIWRLGPSAGLKGMRGAPTRPAKSARCEPDFGAPHRQATAPDLHARYEGAIVPPRQYDVMFGPVYVPQPGPALRPGALDFKAIATRGHAC